MVSHRWTLPLLLSLLVMMMLRVQMWQLIEWVESEPSRCCCGRRRVDGCWYHQYCTAMMCSPLMIMVLVTAATAVIVAATPARVLVGNDSLRWTCMSIIDIAIVEA